MSVFLKFFYELCMLILANIWRFFSAIGGAFVKALAAFKDYYNIFVKYSGDFGAVGWIMAVISIAVLLAIFGLLAYIAARFILRRVRRRRSAASEDELMDEVKRLNGEVVRLLDEKSAIMAMKVSRLGLRPGEDDSAGDADGGGKPAAPAGGAPTGGAPMGGAPMGAGRFVKLAAVDAKYAGQPFELNDPQDYTLTDLVDAFREFACKSLRLYYERDLIMAYVAGMACSRLIILEGISGTGKTSLPYAWGKFLKRDSAICAVQPSWRDRSELVGYFNEFTKRFNESDFLKSLYEFTFRGDIGFIVLDEMNLARIEYYFAEILSVLEMPDQSEWKIDLVPDKWPDDPVNIVGGKCPVPNNVWFVGTANNDDSTFTITDKVYDRSVPIQINSKGVAFECEGRPPMQVESAYLSRLFAEAGEQYAISDELMDRLNSLDQFFIDNFRLAFGNRIVRQIRSFVPAYVACGGTEIAGLDYMLTYKILRKLEGLNLAFLKDNLKKLQTTLDRTFGKGNMPHAKEYIARLMKSV